MILEQASFTDAHFLVPLEKLTAFIDEIFENEDSLPADISTSVASIPHEWFSIHTIEASRPHPSVPVIQKLTKLISQVAKPRKRIRLSRDAPRKTTNGLAEMETVVLNRLLKILERSVKAGEIIDPFGHVAPINGDKRAKTSKKIKGKINKSKVKETDDTPDAGMDNVGGEEQEEDVLTEENLQKMEKLLEIALESVLSADSCIALLTADKLPKQV